MAIRNVAVAVSDCRRVTERKVDATGRQADVVEDSVQTVTGNNLTNLPFDVGEEHLRPFDTRARRRTHVETNLTRIHGRKEISPNKENQGKGREHRGSVYSHEGAAPLNDPFEQLTVLLAHLFEAPVEGLVQLPDSSVPG